MKKMLISSLLLSGALLVGGQAFGQFQSFQDQTLQRERFEEGTPMGSDQRPGTVERDSTLQQGDTFRDQESEMFSGRGQESEVFSDSDRQRFEENRQEQFGVGPRFDTRGDIRTEQQDRWDDQPGAGNMREQGSSAIQGPGGTQGQGGMQSPGGSGIGGGQGGAGGTGGTGGTGGGGGGGTGGGGGGQ